MVQITHHSTKPPKANTATHAPPPTQIYSKPPSLNPSKEGPIFFKPLFMTPSHPRRG